MKHLILLFSAVLVIFGCSSNNNGTVTVVPLAPTNLTGAVISTTQINLTWTENATNEDGYKIERKTGAGNYAVVGSTNSNMTTFSDLGLTPSTSYTYRVYAYNSAGNSLQYSNELTISTQDSIPSWLTNGLVAYYPFNGNANDESGNGNNGTVNGATLASDRNGNINKAYSFNGISDYINGQINNFTNTSIMTLSAWINYNGDAGGQPYDLFFEYGSYGRHTFAYAYNYNNTNLDLYSNCHSNPYSTINLNNAWHHVVVVDSLSNSKLYVDGNLIQSWNYGNSDNCYQGDNNFLIGGGADNQFVTGKLDDIRIYNRALSATEVAYLAAH